MTAWREPRPLDQCSDGVGGVWVVHDLKNKHK